VTADLLAGDFAPWLSGLQRAMRGEQDSDVPCGDCTACCTASQFIHVGPDETDALAAIPTELLFRAPGMPRGHRVMGYDEHGHCPMFSGAGCLIYEDRPRTCRTYDCRVFPATEVTADDGDATKARIAERARRWQFTYEAAGGSAEHAAATSAATFLRDHRAELDDDLAPVNPTQLAVLAIEVHDIFLAPETGAEKPSTEGVLVELRRRFPPRRD
jgi:Fe-S-cluster containining protein